MKTRTIKMKKLAVFLQQNGLRAIATKQAKNPIYINWVFEDTTELRRLVEEFRLLYGKAF